MEVFAKIVNSFSCLTIFAISSILDVWQDFEFASETSNDLQKKPRLRCLTGFWTHPCINYFLKTIPYLFTKFDWHILSYISIVHGQIHVTLCSTVVA